MTPLVVEPTNGGPSPVERGGRARKKEKIFQATITRDAWMLLAFLALPAIALAWQGTMLASDGNATGSTLLAGAALLVVVACVWTAYRLGQLVRVTPDRFEYEHRGRKVVIPWSEMKKFFPPSLVQRHFRSARLSDGVHEVRIDSMSFAEFDLLMSLITVARKTRAPQGDQTYQL